MRDFYNKFDSFCRKHERFGIRNLMMIIVIINAAVYLLSYMSRSSPFYLYNMLSFSPVLVLQGQVWRILTYAVAVAPGTNIIILAISLFFYLFIGRVLEAQWGRLKFTIFYFSGVIITAIFGLIFNCGISSAYINLSMFMAFASLYPDQKVLLYFFIPIKMKWLAYASLLYYVYIMIAQWALFPANLVPIAALINYAIYFAPQFIEMIRRMRKKRQCQQQTVIDFDRERRRRAAPKKEGGRCYTHKCEVCGRTDVSHPELEFRYCSRCAGYHCYCIDHINNHQHVTDA